MTTLATWLFLATFLAVVPGTLRGSAFFTNGPIADFSSTDFFFFFVLFKALVGAAFPGAFRGSAEALPVGGLASLLRSSSSPW